MPIRFCGIKCSSKKGVDVFHNPDNNVKNVYHYLKKSLYDTDELIENISGLEEEKRYIGALPIEWINALGGDNIGEDTAKVFKILSDFADCTSDMPANEGHYYGSDERYKKLLGRLPGHILVPVENWLNKIEELEEKLGQVFDEKPEISYLSMGSFGLVFKIKVNGKTCALKIYFDDGYKKEENGFSHGAASEIANAVYLNRTLKPSQCSKFYCAKIPAKDCEGGFLLTEYLDGSKNSTRSNNQRLDWFMQEGPYWGRITFQDAHGDNFSNGKLIDYGAIEYTFKNRKTLALAKELMPAVVQGDVEKALKLKELYGKTPEYRECMEHLKLFSSEEKIDEPEEFLDHCVDYNITKKMIDAFRALGVDYSRIEILDSFSIKDLELREKFEELFCGDSSMDENYN